MENFLKTKMSYGITVLRWVVFAVGIGLVVGCVGVAFHFCIAYVTELRMEHPWLIWLLPVGGFAIALLYHVSGLGQDRGTNFVLSAVRDNERLHFGIAPLIFIGSTITHLLGGSAGREGAALQLGGSIASAIGHRAKLDCASVRTLVVCGMSAGFSAVFGTPITAALFAVEVVHVGVIHYSSIFPAILSALVGFMVANFFGGAHTAFDITGIPALTPIALLQVTIMGVLLAVLSIVFYEAIHTSAHFYQKYIPNAMLRPVVGGVLVILLTLLVGTYDYNGAGMEVIHAAIAGIARPEAFALKLLFTAVTLGAGFKGGEIVPVFFTGATFGCIVGPLLGLDPSFSAALGMAALFCGVTNCPLTSILLSFELFGGAGLPLFALCCAVAYVLSGYGGLYREQKIVFSKFKPEIYEEHYKDKVYKP